MMTRQEERDEFWMLTQGILQDSKIDTTEARVVKRWLEEHQKSNEFAYAIEKLGAHLSDGWIDRFESQAIIEALGNVLQVLRQAAQQEVK